MRSHYRYDFATDSSPSTTKFPSKHPANQSRKILIFKQVSSIFIGNPQVRGHSSNWSLAYLSGELPSVVVRARFPNRDPHVDAGTVRSQIVGKDRRLRAFQKARSLFLFGAVLPFPGHSSLYTYPPPCSSSPLAQFSAWHPRPQLPTLLSATSTPSHSNARPAAQMITSRASSLRKLSS